MLIGSNPEKNCAAITMYCGVSIADDVDRQQSKKRMRIRLPFLEANVDSNFVHGVSRHVENLQMSENLGLL
jgi:hypothetical protein